VRNPIDTLVSLFNFTLTGTHDQLIAPEGFAANQEVWSKYIRKEISVWHDFYRFWTQSNIPIHIIRYEDVMIDPETTYSGVMSFLLRSPTIEGCAAQKYV